MLAWMGYATLVGGLLAASGALLEQYSPWLAGRRRFVWLTVIVGSLLLAVAVTVAPSATSSATINMSSSAPVVSAVKESGPLAALGTTEHSSLGTTKVAASSPSLDAVLIVVWLAGSALCMIVLIVSAWRVSRMRRVWRESVIAGVPVLVSHDVGPAVIGLVHHGIVVPSWVEALRDDEQRTVMTHEREHVRAGDPLLLWGTTLLVSLAPWNAALWFALRRLRHAIEMDCDARVLRSRPDARAYCTLLLDVGERTLAGVAPMAALAEPATLLERRIEAMTAPTHARRMRVVLGALAALLLVAVACWAPRPEVAPRARVAALVSELNSLLAKDSIQHSLTVAERADAARTLASARANGNANTDSIDASAFRQYGQRVDSIAHADFPEAFEKRDDATVVAVLFGPDGQIVRSSAKRFAVAEVFDVFPGRTEQPLVARSSTYLLARVLGAMPVFWKSGSQFTSGVPHTVVVYGVLGEEVKFQPGLSRDSLLELASHYESTTVHGMSTGTHFVALRFDRNGAVIAHGNVGYGPSMARPSITAMRQSFFGIESTKDDDEAQLVLLRAGEPDAMPGPLYVLIVRPRR